MIGKRKTAYTAVFFLFGVSVQHSVLTRRHFPDDSGCRRSFYDPSSEYFRILGFQSKCQCRNHFKIVSLNDVSVSTAGAADSAVFMQNSAFAYRSDIRIYGGSEYSEQIGDLALREPYSVCRTDRYPSVLDRYRLCRHNFIRLVKSSNQSFACSAFGSS